MAVGVLSALLGVDRLQGAAVSARFTILPATLEEANAFVLQYHRHHPPVQGHKFSLALASVASGEIVGVAIIGRPVARALDTGLSLEVTRLATDGTLHACSALYAAAWRATRALGYNRLGTYILASEPGTTLRAAGWRLVGQTTGDTGDRRGRPRVDVHPLQAKLRWEVTA